jgi:hydrogenase nickel incorporation protein HypA/HybF
MHEWALAEAVISTAIEVAEKERISELAKIKIKLGELQQIDAEIFEFALKEIIQPQRSLLKKVKIEIEIEKAILKCRVCGQEWAFEDSIKKLAEEESESIHFVPEIAHVYVRCPKCKSPDFEVLKGRGVWIESIEGK